MSDKAKPTLSPQVPQPQPMMMSGDVRMLAIAVRHADPQAIIAAKIAFFDKLLDDGYLKPLPPAPGIPMNMTIFRVLVCKDDTVVRPTKAVKQ
jgi:hypothetical protein